MRIQHNVMAMNAYRNYTNNTSALAKNLERLSSGYKINRAGDDAAGLAISEKMRAQISGLEAAQKNVKDGQSLVNTAEGAMQEIQDMLNRMVSLATQSANGTYDDAVDRKALQAEVDQLKEEINRIADSTNFNGIKLLDGSLATEGAAASTDIKVKGVISSYSVGAAGVYETSAIKTTDSTAYLTKDGDSFQYTVALDNGSAYTVNLTLKMDENNNQSLVAEDGTAYAGTKGTSTKTIQMADIDKAVLNELQKTGLNDEYVISSDGAGAFTFTAKNIGTSVPAIAGADYSTNVASTGVSAGDDVGGKVAIKITTSARDVGYEIKAEDITEYDGTNYDEAVFTINGHKFVLLSNGMDGTTTGTTNQEYLRAVQGLGDDVTVLVGGVGGLKDPGTTTATDPVVGDAANTNFAQNIAKIAEITGLNVTAGVDESTYSSYPDSGASPTTGIRLSAGKGSISGGLVLQIGDTSDSYNQLRVGIKDMHTTSLGIDDLDISTAAGAQAAIDTIKTAINTVSSVRGTLGAISNRLDHTANNLSVMTENITDAESTIRDTDIAEEMMAYTKNNILVQSAQAMLAQANQVPQGVLQLLQ